MKNLNKKLIFSLLLPIGCLVLLTAYKHIKIITGIEMTIPIEGYDPRDLLSGHYLIFQLDLDQEQYCDRGEDRDPVYLCLNQESFDDELYEHEISYLTRFPSEECKAVLMGRCNRGRFVAGIERFYIPEEHGYTLDRVVRKGKGKILVAIDQKGKAVIKDLLINDKSWKAYVKKDE